jgi:hypothetical protein
MSSNFVEPKPFRQPIRLRLRSFVRMDFLEGVSADWIAPVVAIFAIAALALFVAA